MDDETPPGTRHDVRTRVLAPRFSTLDGMSPFRRSRTGSNPQVEGVTPRRPHAGMLRREQKALLRAREVRLRDLGGLIVEMYRRGAFRQDLLAEGCAEVVGIDTRLVEIDDILHPERRAPRCECGTPILRGSNFCPNCGRSLEADTDGVRNGGEGY
jgi:hypothetical protein